MRTRVADTELDRRRACYTKKKYQPLNDTWGSVPGLGCISRLDGVDHSNRGNNLCHNPYGCCGVDVCLVNDRCGGGGDGGGEDIRWDLSEGCTGAEGHQYSPKLGVPH